jgi:O-antigen biosynthesis protein WbqP
MGIPTAVRREPASSIGLNPRYLRVKYALDRIVAALLLLLLWPLLALIAVAIRLDSPGPAIYRQRRIGEGGSPFTILKFRTMQVGTPCLSTEDIQRQGVIPFTRLGPLLRRVSLDELPQLFNVLNGTMSFVGPRPALPSQVDVNTLRMARGVHCARPGITGLAQVMGRDDLEVETKVGYDAAYCLQVGLREDARLLAMTLGVVSSGRGSK